jgi:uncharacterized protein (DUF302 family)
LTKVYFFKNKDYNNYSRGYKMAYYFNKIIDSSFEEAITKVTEALKAQGFGVLTEIDVKSTMKQKLDVDFRNYRILGACNPPFAYKALSVEDKIGTMLPCNVIVQELSDGKIEIAAIDPIASMSAVQNPALSDIAFEVQDRLKKVVESL